MVSTATSARTSVTAVGAVSPGDASRATRREVTLVALLRIGRGLQRAALQRLLQRRTRAEATLIVARAQPLNLVVGAPTAVVASKETRPAVTPVALRHTGCGRVLSALLDTHKRATCGTLCLQKCCATTICFPHWHI